MDRADKLIKLIEAADEAHRLEKGALMVGCQEYDERAKMQKARRLKALSAADRLIALWKAE